MDLEAELIRSSNWRELKRLYSGRVGSSWELAWVHLLRFHDKSAAIQCFQKALNDPHFEQASYLMLWKLGARPRFKHLLEPSSLRLYDAFQQAEPRPLAYWLAEKSDRHIYSEFILKRLSGQIKNILPDEVELLEKAVSSSASSSYFLGQIWEKKLKEFEKAEKVYRKLYSDPWVKKILNESSRILFDLELSERMRLAYARRDGLLLKRLFKALDAKSKKLKADLPPQYRQAFEKAIAWDNEHLTENLLGFEFWKTSEWSPSAVYLMLKHLFSPEGPEAPDFVKAWDLFFQSDRLVSPPMHLDSDSLCLWQIHVELKPEALSEALLRFPSEERFLFLWSVRHYSAGEMDKRAWPDHEQESETVRRNLERTFDRSTNKLLWFDRLRRCGCSQTFYEYALSRIVIPVSWVLEDLKSKLIKNSPQIRIYLKEKLSIIAPDDAQSHLLSTSQLQEVLNWLTPSEKQEVILSRFVLSPIPQDLINDEILDLLWDAKTQVGDEVFRVWRASVLEYLKSFPLENLSARHWVWIESAWEEEALSLESFSPKVGSKLQSFPWDSYLNCAFQHKKINLVLAALYQLEDERSKIFWIERLLENSEEKNLKNLIKSLKDPSAKARLLYQFHRSKEEYLAAIKASLDWMEATPILNEQAFSARCFLECVELISVEERTAYAENIQQVLSQMKSLGMADFEFLRRAVALLESLGDWVSAWKVFAEAWWLSDDHIKLREYDTFLNLAFHAKKIEETQRLLIQRLFEKTGSDALQKRILESLLDAESVFQIRHIRQEFVDKATKVAPLHPDILSRRALYDYRATLLWDCFYGTELTNAVQAPNVTSKRKFEFWGFTEVMSPSNSLKFFTRYLDFYSPQQCQSETHQFYDSARRILQRLAKQFSLKKKVGLTLHRNLSSPIRFCFQPPRIEVDLDFFNDLDEEIWSAICVGFFQMLCDREKGLYEESALMERFFQGTLLSGSPISSIIRFLVWLAMAEKLIEPQVNQYKPQELIQKIPLLNHLLIFYLGDDFQRKMQDCGIQLR